MQGSKLIPTPNLKFRVDHQGVLRASFSKSAGEFVFSLELLQLLCLLQKNKNYNTAKLATDLQTSFNQLQNFLPDKDEIEELLHDLQESGFLTSESNPKQNLNLNDGFGDPWIQWAMLADKFRTTKYFQALAKVITAQDIVVDVGAGTGILSAWALKCGAKQVYAIEETATSKHILSTSKKLNPQTIQNLKVFPGNSENSTPPKNTTIVVSELFGNDPFQEGLLPTMRGIALKVDRKKAVFIPNKLELMFEIIDLNGGNIYPRVKAFQTISSAITQTTSMEDFYTAFLNTAKQELDFSYLSFAAPLQNGEFSRATLPIIMESVNLSPPPIDFITISGTKTITTTQHIATPVAIYWFRVILHPDVEPLSNHPQEKDYCAHWSPILIPLKNSLPKNTTIEVAWELSEDETSLEIEIKSNDKIIGKR